MKQHPQNTIHIEGVVKKDSQLRETKVGCPVCQFLLLYEDTWNGKVQHSIFDVVYFGEPARDISRDLKEGVSVTVDGSIKEDIWRTPQGFKKTKIKIVADIITIQDPNFIEFAL